MNDTAFPGDNDTVALNATATPKAPSGGESDIIDNPAVQVLFGGLYSAIFILGVFGNVLVCFVVMRNKAMRTVTNFFITNLALSDILLCVLAVPFTPLYSFLGEWIFGTALCHLVPFAQGVSVYISTLTLTSIAVDRFFVIIYPFKERMRLATSIVIICSIWMFSIMATLPYGIFMHLTKHHIRIGNHLCEENWPTETSRFVFSGSTIVLQFVVPFVIIACCYVKVSTKLSDRARAKPGAKSSRKEELERERKRRTNRMLIAMVAIFGFSWLPLNVTNLAQDISLTIAHWDYFNLQFFISHAIAMSSTCYNPFVYAWLNENFRKEFKQVLPCFGRGPSARAGRRVSNYKTEKSCNGNDATQVTLLPPPSSAGGALRVHVANAREGAVTVVYNAPTESVTVNMPHHE